MGRSVLRPYMIATRRTIGKRWQDAGATGHSGSVIVPVMRKVWPVPAALL
jgi:hypothetical protein